MSQVKFNKDSQDCYGGQGEYNWPIADWYILNNNTRSLCTSQRGPVSLSGELTKHEIKMAGYWPSSLFGF